MKCQSCGKNEAEQRLYINILGQTADVKLCASCIRRLKVYVAGMVEALRLNEFSDESELYIIKHNNNNFPDEIGEQVRVRRRLNELRQQMRDAVAAEDYEAAASLRDEIETEYEKGLQK